MSDFSKLRNQDRAKEKVVQQKIKAQKQERTWPEKGDSLLEGNRAFNRGSRKTMG